MSHDKVNHGKSDARRDGSYDGNDLEDVELGIPKGKDSLQDEQSN